MFLMKVIIISFCGIPSDVEILGAYRVMPVGEQLAQHGVTGLYSNSLFKYHDNAYSCLEKCVEIGRGFIQKPYQKSKVLDYLWQGIFDFIKRYPDYKYLLGVLTIHGTFPEKVQKLIISFYNIYFSSTADFCTPIALFTAENVQDDTPFCGEDFRADWSMLNHLLREEGYELPGLLNRVLNGSPRADRRFLHSQKIILLIR